MFDVYEPRAEQVRRFDVSQFPIQQVNAAVIRPHFLFANRDAFDALADWTLSCERCGNKPTWLQWNPPYSTNPMTVAFGATLSRDMESGDQAASGPAFFP